MKEQVLFINLVTKNHMVISCSVYVLVHSKLFRKKFKVQSVLDTFIFLLKSKNFNFF